GNTVVGSLRIERTFAELKLVQMFLPTVVRLEYGVMELLERLVAADFNHAADCLAGKLFADGPTRQVDRHDVQVSGRHGHADRAVDWAHPVLRRLALVPRRDLVFREQHLERARPAW